MLRGSIKPRNLMFVDDASLEGEASTALSKHNVYLTKSISPVRNDTEEDEDKDEDYDSIDEYMPKKKVTLNLKLPKGKLKALKHIAAIIQTRDPMTNALVTKQKKFKVEYLKRKIRRKLKNKRDRNRAIFLSTVYKSIQRSVTKDEKSTKLPSNMQSISVNQSLNNPIIKGLTLSTGKEEANFLKASKPIL